MTDSSSSENNSTTRASLPAVVIVGRPNVGKSTLFNRLLRRRRAITDATPGVTRDPVEEVLRIGPRALRLIDTGGFRLDGEGLDDIVSELSLAVVREADVVLLVLEVDQMTAEDEAFIELLRPEAERLVVVVNKVDTPEKEAAVWNFHSLGFPAVVGISAEHRRNIGELIDAIVERLPEVSELPEPTVLPGLPDASESMEPARQKAAAAPGVDGFDVRVAIVGKPNTGKSTLMNRLAGGNRSLVSELPGTTRDVVYGDFAYRGKRFAILDTAGIRRKNRVDDDIEYYSVNRAIGAIGDADVVLLVIDSLENVTDQDKKIAQLAASHGKGILIVLNKWDLLEHIANQRNAMEDRVHFLFPILEYAPIIPLSALDGTGEPELLKTMLTVWNQLNHRVDTGKLNASMKGWNEHYSPPRDKKLAYRVRYVTQVGTNPVRFVLFVNRKKGFPAPWIQYLTNRIRSEFGFRSVPVEVLVRES
ncbi:MAG TPA: ribosome biogenesis GTPase Der [Spirochaetia bacterium]|nr:ribosome biogenesis GTPase Der [Spirochaetia bacterium]